MDQLGERVLSAHERSLRGHVTATRLLQRRGDVLRATWAEECTAAASDRLERLVALRRKGQEPLGGMNAERGAGGG